MPSFAKPNYFDNAYKCGSDLIAMGTEFIANVSNGMLSELHPRAVVAQGLERSQNLGIS